MVRSERRRGMPLTGWFVAPSFASAFRASASRVSVGSDRGATRRIRKVAALGASAALTLLPLWTPLAPAAWATDPTSSASPSPKREVTATPRLLRYRRLLRLRVRARRPRMVMMFVSVSIG